MTSPASRESGGFTLIEAVLACFLLGATLLMAVWLLDASMRSIAESDRRQAACLVADNVLDRMRETLSQDFGAGLDAFNGLVSSEDGFQVTTYARLKPLSSPCGSLEEQYSETAAYPAPARKVLERSAWQAEVVVSWSDRPADRVLATTLIADWREPTFTVELNPGGPVTVSPRGTADFRATARDPFEDEIPDLVFSWYVKPRDSSGTVANVSRDGQQATYQNHIRTFGGNYEVVPGSCDLVARGFYRGQVVEGTARLVNQ